MKFFIFLVVSLQNEDSIYRFLSDSQQTHQLISIGLTTDSPTISNGPTIFELRPEIKHSAPKNMNYCFFLKLNRIVW